MGPSGQGRIPAARQAFHAEAADLNLRAVGWLLGCVHLLVGGFMLVPAIIAVLFGETLELWSFVGSAAIAAVIGGILMFRFRGTSRTSQGRADYFRREGLATVGISWLVIGVLGALPYLLSGAIEAPMDALFESVSGFTTTGATILEGPAIDGLSNAMAFWRSFSHWLGGIGVVLVFVVLFPTGGRSLFRSEVPGVSREAMQHRVRDSATGLMLIYVGLTLVEMLCLMLAGLMPIDAAIHAFGTLATGGFSSHASSVAFFNSVTVELILVVFMFMSGINFGLYDSFVRTGWRNGWRLLSRSEEVRVYAGLIFGSALLIGMVLWFWGGSNGSSELDLPDYSSLGLALRDSLFAVVSIQTSTGYGTADFDRWPEFCRMLLMLLAFVGASAGSTGGGLKVMRFIIIAKASVRGFLQFSRPRSIQSVRVDGHPLGDRTVAAVTGYFGMWSIVFLMGTLCITAFGVDLLSASTAVLATLNNIGPGLNAVGPAMNFGAMPDLVKLLLSLFMILGRLEFYAIVVLFLPRFWRH